MRYDFPANVEQYNAENDFERFLIPAGKYTVRVMHVKENTSKTNQRPQIALQLQLAAAESPAWEYNKWVWHNITLIPLGEKGHGYTLHDLKAFGFCPDGLGVIHFDAHDFVGREVNADIDIYQDSYGKKRNKVIKIDAIPTDEEPEGFDSAAPETSSAQSEVLPF